MKPSSHPGRQRHIGGWALLALAVLVAGVWLASIVWSFGIVKPGCNISVSWGGFYWDGFKNPYGSPGWFRQVNPRFDLQLWVSRPSDVDSWWNGGVFACWKTGSHRGVRVCLWPVPIVLAAAGVPVLRSGVAAWRWANAGTCHRCGYDKRGLAEGAVCPECGRGRQKS